ncbi:type VI secretion system ATPase TssH [Trinickia soli]|uniref:Type VI secretion system ATPase TssH n=1 Tax=Trinickia soli TaxID=380675 RepID=A0A2N7VXK3_9BURK|nr:type VI secretion system ATPase TssH [Trinickia soli]PMS21884.1 type VI secretion system ATPase TssH [Trinickia soli]CAB3650007.1 Protein ClpV1 [Trinickia soli]
MAELTRAVLFGKLSPIAYRAIEGSVTLGRLRGHARVELAHWLHQILRHDDSDLHRIACHLGTDVSLLVRESSDALARLSCCDGQPIDLSADVLEAAERGWTYASLIYGVQQVRTGHLLIGIVAAPALRRALIACVPSLRTVDEALCARAFDAIAVESPEGGPSADRQRPARAPGEDETVDFASDALARYTVDLTALAREGKLDPIVGRHGEIRRVIDILLRRRQNNPLLTGDAGVGKTAVVEGLAQRIVEGKVPAPLRDVCVRVLDIGLLQAGAAAKGEFEARLRKLVEQVQAAHRPVILFIDEAHTLMGAGGAAGTGDAANLLKPALARGTLRTIAATTWSEYKRHVEKDPALTRRFQTVAVDEPDQERALAMLRAIAPTMEAHHGVQVLDEALHAAVALSHRYINDRQLPDKAVSLLDTVCARVAASRHTAPPELDRAQERVATLAAQRTAALREHAIGRCEPTQVRRVDETLAGARAHAAALEALWREQVCRVDAVLTLRNEICDDARFNCESASAQAQRGDGDGRRAELARLERELNDRQGETPFVAANVDREAVAAVVQEWTGVPVRRMLRDELEGVLGLAGRLDADIVGQPQATRRIARRMQSARAGLQRPGRPLGVFLLAGPSGVGKTETARALADSLYGGERNLLVFHMSEFQEGHTVSTLKGAPPGYVGYGEGGALTEAVRRKPYCVLLLDEIDKAHRDVHALFYQVFDKGVMEDGQGRMIDFRNTVVLLTTNVGCECVTQAWNEAGGDAEAAYELARAPLRERLLTVFPAALLARMTTVPYFPLSNASLRSIVETQLGRTRDQVLAHHASTLEYDDAVIAAVTERCAHGEGGARLVDAVIAEALVPEIACAVLSEPDHQTNGARIVLRLTDGAFRCLIERRQ